MKQRQKKRRTGSLHLALHRAHGLLASEGYELALSRRALVSLNRKSQQDRAQARGQIAALESDLELMRRRLAQVGRFVDDACYALGNAPVHALHPRDRAFLMHLRRPASQMVHYMLGPNPAKEQHTHAVVMRALEIDVVRDRLAQMTHARVRLRDGNVAYSLSDAAIDQAPIEVLRDTITREVASRMAEALISELRPDYRDKQSYRFEHEISFY